MSSVKPTTGGVLSLEPLQTSVRGLQVEPARVPLATDPFFHLLVLLVFRVSQCHQQFIVAVDAAGVLWRARVSSGQTERMSEGGVGRQDPFDKNLVLPTIAEVVFVNELPLRHRREVSHRVLLLVEHLAAQVVELAVG